MSIRIVRFCETVTLRMCSCLLKSAKRCFFKSRLKRSDSTARSRSESDSEFQTIGPATEKAQFYSQSFFQLIKSWTEQFATSEFLKSHLDQLFNPSFP